MKNNNDIEEGEIVTYLDEDRYRDGKMSIMYNSQSYNLVRGDDIDNIINKLKDFKPTLADNEIGIDNYLTDGDYMGFFIENDENEWIYEDEEPLVKPARDPIVESKSFIKRSKTI
jgi:hypothetical protein